MSDFKKIKIISDGTVTGTKVVDENDIPLTDISRITWTVSAEDALATAIIEFINIPVELEGEINE